MRLVTVHDLLWSGPFGGAVFSGLFEEAEQYRFVAPSSVMPRPPVIGETWLIRGVIRKHPKFGPQVEVNKALLQRPSGRLLVNTLSRSRTFSGIGPVKAQRLWEEFGEAIYELLDRNDTGPFIDVIGPDLSEVLVSGWRTLTVETEVYAWLDRHGVPVGLASKLIGIYGDNVVGTLEDNPYRLLAFTNWKQADSLARSVGIDGNDEKRLVAASDAAVYQRLQFAHTWADRNTFVEVMGIILGIPQKAAENALAVAIKGGSVIEVAGGIQGLGPASMESYVATRAKELLSDQYESAQMTFRRVPDRKFLSSFHNE